MVHQTLSDLIELDQTKAELAKSKGPARPTLPDFRGGGPEILTGSITMKSYALTSEPNLLDVISFIMCTYNAF